MKERLLERRKDTQNLVEIRNVLHPEDLGTYKTVDRLIIDRILELREPKAFSKGNIYRAMGEAVPQARRFFLTLPESNQGTVAESPSEAGRVLHILREQGAVYIKNVDVTHGGGSGIVKVELDARNVTARFFRMGMYEMRQLIQKLSEHIQMLGTAHDDDSTVKLPILKTVAHQSAEYLVEKLLQHAFAQAEYAIEEPIPIPLYEGKTWEVRHIVQSPGGQAQVTGTYAKVGSNEHLSNFTAGGSVAKATEVAQGVYQQHCDMDSMHAQKAAEQFLQQCDLVALQAVKQLNAYLKAIGTRYVSEMDRKELYVRLCAVDITGRLNNGVLTPIVGELQYPLGYMSYEIELQRSNPAALVAIHQANADILRHDTQFLHSRV